MSKITTIKIIHTIIWAVMAGATFIILYSAITKTYNIYLWISLVLLTIETLVLIFNKWTCPLTPMAEKYTDDRRDNFDIYLPKKKYPESIMAISKHKPINSRTILSLLKIRINIDNLKILA
jgi:hypothetical protein